MIARVLLLATLAMAIHGTASAEAGVVSFEQALHLAQSSPEVSLAIAHAQHAQRLRDAAAGIVTAELRTGFGHSWSSGSDLGSGAAAGGRGAMQPITLSATLRVLPFGPAADDVQRAEWRLEEATIALREAEAAAAVAVAERYLAALRASQEVALRETHLALAELRVEAVRTRLAVGAANPAQLLDAELEASIARAEVATAVRQHIGALAALSAALGVEVTGVEGGPPPAAMPSDVVVDEWLGEAANVLVAEIRAREAELAYQSRRRDFLPSGTVNVDIAATSGSHGLQFGANLDTRAFQPAVTLAYDPNHSAPGGTPGDASRSVSIGITARIPLDASMPAALDAARLGVEHGHMRSAQARALAALDVDDRRRQWEAASANEALSLEVLEARRTTLLTTEERAALGVASELDVRQAELAVQGAELALLRSHDAVLVALMRLVQSLAMHPMEVF